MTKPPSPRPLSVKVITAYFFWGAIWNVLGAGGLLEATRSGPFVRFFPVYPHTITGWPAVAWVLFLLVLKVYLGFGLWQLQQVARRIAIIFMSYTVLANVVLAFLLALGLYFLSNHPETASPAVAQRMAEDRVVILPFFIRTLIVGIMLNGTFLYFLITRKAAFGKRATPTETL